MECDLCGKPATSKATIEGAKLTVCANCAKHGTDVRSLPQQAPAKRQAAASTSLTKEELVEQVRPDTAKLLRQHREKLGLNHEQFAAKLQIRASTYHHYESGTTLPDITTARKLEHILKVPLVVHIKTQTPVATAQEEKRGMMMADFMKKKK